MSNRVQEPHIQHELLQEVFRVARIGSWEALPEGRLIWSDQTLALFGVERSQFNGTIGEFYELVHPDDLERVKHVEDFTDPQKSYFRSEYRIVRPDGEIRHMHQTAIVLRDKQAKPIGFNGVVQDVTELVTALHEREELSRKLEETLEAIADSFMIVDRNWTVTFANKVAEKLVAIDRDHMLGKNLWDLFPESENGEFHKRYQKLFESGGTERFVAYSPRSNRWLAISAFLTTHGIAISARDVTEEHVRDEQLRLLETAVARLNDIVMIAETDSQIGDELPTFVFANDALERVMGFTAKEMIGKTAAALRGKATQSSEISKLETALERNSEARSQIINYTKNGTPVWLDLDVVPIQRDDGHVTHWVSVARDITDAKRAEKRLALSEERFRLVAGATNDVIWDCDLASGEMWWNDNLASVFGYDPDKFEDRLTWWDANIHPEEQRSVLERMNEIIEGSDKFWQLDYRFRRADGTFSYVRDHGAILRDENGAATRILGNMTDVTEQRMLEEQLLQSQKMEAIGKFTGGVAHDFNNLLSVIMGNLELLHDEIVISKKLPDDAEDLIQAGISAVERGSHLTGQMLSYAREAHLEPVPTELNAVVLETASWISRTFDANIELTTELDTMLGKILVDPNTLQNSIVNLLLNARDAMKTGGNIRIETRHIRQADPFLAVNGLPVHESGYAMLSISDTGGGIPQEHLEKVFDPFFTTKPVGQGSGLGLSMVHGFVRQSGGDLRINSTPGLGTSVTLFFKILSPNGIANHHSEIDLSPARTGLVPPVDKRKILLAEDDAAVAQVVVRTLRQAGFDVHPAVTGDAAYLEFQKNSKVDLLLTDVSMPGSLNGEALAEACWKVRGDLPVLFLTGHPTDSMASGAWSLHSYRRLTKPVSRRELLAAIASLLKFEERTV